MAIIVMCSVGNAAADDGTRTYTKDNPLVYEDLWDMAPYTYLDEGGTPMGYNIDLVKLIFERLNIPYVIRLRHTNDVFEDIRTRRADLTIGMFADYHYKNGHFGKSVISLFTYTIAASKKHPVAVREFTDLRNEHVYVRPSSYAYHEMMKSGMTVNVVPTSDIKEAIISVNATDSGMVLWNSMALKSLVRKYDLKNIALSPVNMDHGEYRFLSGDTVLLQKMDSVFTSLEMDESLTQLRKKWFYPDNTGDELMAYFFYILVGGVIVLVGFMFYYLYYRYRERRVRSLLNQQNRRLSLYLQTGKVRMFTYDTTTRLFGSFSAESTKTQYYDMAAFSQYFIDDDFRSMMISINDIASGRKDSESLSVQLRRGRRDKDIFYFELRLAVLRRIDGVATTLIGTLLDMTKERKKTVETRNTLLKYRTMFNTAMADMILYDNDGNLVEINEKACKTFGIDDKDVLIRRRFNLFALQTVTDITMDSDLVQWSTAIVDLDAMERRGLRSGLLSRRGKIYYELMEVPIYDAQKRRIGIFVTGQDVTETVNVIHKERLRMKRITMATDSIQRYVDNIGLALSVSHIRLGYYNPSTRSFDLVYDVNRPAMNVSQLRCMRALHRSCRSQAEKLIINMDRRKQQGFVIRLRTIMRDREMNLPLCYQVNAVPLTEHDGTITQYFCLFRNITKLMATETALEEQTKKAQEAETLKNSFLKNMSHEIRTPLNVVIGFAEMFENEHSLEDEAVFSDQIKTNAKILLYLINDILLLSRIDAKMVEINNEPVEVSELFKTRCLMGWAGEYKREVHTSIECQYEKLVVETDQTQLGYVIEQLAKMAGYFTDHGFIRTKCDYFNNELTLTFEDTGRGIDEDSKKNLFDITRRFEGGVSSSGFELTICEKLIRLMGGKIFVESQIGKGTTFWVTIPCKLIEKEKGVTTSLLDSTLL